MRKILLGLTALSMTMPVAMSPADAQYRARTYRYHHTVRCHRGGTVGAIVGGGAGALIGSAVTHGAAGPIIGAAGGALLGRHIAHRTTRPRCY
jgi:outer membrane lipoprotein SlyB